MEYRRNEGDWIKKTAGKQLTPGQKAARTKKLKAAAAKAHKRWRINKAFVKGRASEAASKEAFKTHCLTNGWKVAFFEGAGGAPRNGIIDAIAFRLTKSNRDALDVRLVQLKSGKAGVSGEELKRLKEAVSVATVNWLTATYDGDQLHFSPDDPMDGGKKARQAPARFALAVPVSRSFSATFSHGIILRIALHRAGRAIFASTLAAMKASLMSGLKHATLREANKSIGGQTM